MFNVEGTHIYMSVGDTGAVEITATGHTFATEDRALFTIRGMDGTAIIEEPHEIDSNGSFTQYFTNNDTDRCAAGEYTWDVRYVINPAWDGTKIVNGDQVITPFAPQPFTLIGVVGSI